MSSLPLPFLLNRAAGLISLLIVVSALWFVGDWVLTGFRSVFWLVSGLFMLSVALFGRLLVLASLPRRADRAASSPSNPESESVTGSAGARLHVECHGRRTGPVAILTHEWGLDHSVWEGLARRLSDHCQVVVWDLPGLGRSGRPFDAVYSIDRFAKDLRGIVELAGQRPVMLVGHGAGAMITLAFCRLYPKLMGRKIKAVVLIDAADQPLLEISGDSTFLRSVRGAVLEPLIRLSVAGSPAFHLMAWATYLNGLGLLISRAFCFGAQPAREDVDYAAWLGTRQAPGVLAKGLQAMLDAPAPADVATLAVPLLMIAGSCDVLIKPEHVRAMAGRAGGAFVSAEGCGHLGPLADPDAYAGPILQHMANAFPRPEAPARGGSRRAHADVLKATRNALEAPQESRSFAAKENDLPELDSDVDPATAPQSDVAGRGPREPLA